MSVTVDAETILLLTTLTVSFSGPQTPRLSAPAAGVLSAARRHTERAVGGQGRAAELDLHISVAQLDGGMILGSRYTRSITDLIGVEGVRSTAAAPQWRSSSATAYVESDGQRRGQRYVTAGVATGG